MAGGMDSLRLLPGCGLVRVADLGTALPDVMGHLQSFSSALPAIQVVTNANSREVYLNLPDWGVSLVFDETYQLLELIVVDINKGLPVYINKTLIRTEIEVHREVKECPKSLISSHLIENCSGLSLIYTQEGRLERLTLQSTASCFEPVPSVVPTTVSLFPGSHISSSGTDLRLGSPSETVIDVFGLPSKVVERAGLESCRSTDYVYNYYAVGLDFVFGGETHKLKEVQARANQPEDPLFCVYHRCPFRLHLPSLTVTPFTRDSEISRFLPQFSSVTEAPPPFSTEANFTEDRIALQVPGAAVMLVAGYVSAVAIWTSR